MISVLLILIWLFPMGYMTDLSSETVQVESSKGPINTNGTSGGSLLKPNAQTPVAESESQKLHSSESSEYATVISSAPNNRAPAGITKDELNEMLSKLKGNRTTRKPIRKQKQKADRVTKNQRKSNNVSYATESSIDNVDYDDDDSTNKQPIVQLQINKLQLVSIDHSHVQLKVPTSTPKNFESGDIPSRSNSLKSGEVSTEPDEMGGREDMFKETTTTKPENVVIRFDGGEGPTADRIAVRSDSVSSSVKPEDYDMVGYVGVKGELEHKMETTSQRCIETPDESNSRKPEVVVKFDGVKLELEHKTETTSQRSIKTLDESNTRKPEVVIRFDEVKGGPEDRAETTSQRSIEVQNEPNSIKPEVIVRFDEVKGGPEDKIGTYKAEVTENPSSEELPGPNFPEPDDEVNLKPVFSETTDDPSYQTEFEPDVSELKHKANFKPFFANKKFSSSQTKLASSLSQPEHNDNSKPFLAETTGNPSSQTEFGLNPPKLDGTAHSFKHSFAHPTNDNLTKTTVHSIPPEMVAKVVSIIEQYRANSLKNDTAKLKPADCATFSDFSAGVKHTWKALQKSPGFKAGVKIVSTAVEKGFKSLGQCVSKMLGSIRSSLASSRNKTSDGILNLTVADAEVLEWYNLAGNLTSFVTVNGTKNISRVIHIQDKQKL